MNLVECGPRKKDCVSIKINGEKVKKQKRLLLVCLKELEIEFKKRSPQLKIHKIYELCSKSCITVASKASHAVCVFLSSKHKAAVLCYSGELGLQRICVFMCM